MINRRKFLKASCLGAATGFASNLASFNAFAADTSGYKALVCVFLRGGMDSHDLIIPFDITSSRQYEDVRAPLIDGYAESRRRNNLLELGNGNVSGAIGDGREFALPREMAAMHELYQQRRVAVVGNVGPLIEPVNATTFSNGSARVPARIGSHNDQESTWLASTTEGATEGWGGRIGDIMAAANANTMSSFTTVATNQSGVFVNGFDVSGFNLSASGGEVVNNLSSRSFQGSTVFSDAYENALYGLNANHSNLFERDVGSITGNAIDDNLLVRDVFASTPDPSTVFPDSGLGDQLAIVAKMIASRQTLGMRRQIFIVTDRGYDTHSGQVSALPERQLEVAEAMAAFYQSTVEMGVANDVTSFTGSDFGRSLVPNNSGTDHGWGGHHLVMGGAVNGGQILGNIPEPVVGHSQDSGRGRLIPEVSVDQYATALARWFGLTLAECLELFPNLNTLDPEALSGLFDL